MDDVYNFTYDNLGNISMVNSNSHDYNYYYDLSKRVVGYKYDDFRIRYDYLDNNLSDKYYDLDDISKHYNYEYNEEDNIKKVNFDGSYLDYNYDYLNRLSSKKLNDNYEIKYNYVTNGKKTSFLVNSIENNDELYSYKYDGLNNITHVYYNNGLISEYEYDNNNQLINELDYINNKMYLYKYDNSGNIISKKEYQLVKEDTYEYSDTLEDQLIKYNDELISYDGIGNPISIGDINLTWINGRQLQKYEDLNNIITYSYNNDGIRISKNVNGVETKYYLENNDIILEKRGNNVLYYIRDGIGDLIGFSYQDNTYYYIKNIQGDIVEILDSNYNVVARYEYDGYGNIISIKDNNGVNITDNNHIAIINPFRYRSYYYDVETKLYYLNSRYYNPLWGRFINADSYISTGQGFNGYNMYVYTGNNPISRIDADGVFWFTVARAVIGGGIGMGLKVASNAITGKNLSDGIWGAATSGAISGVLMTTGANVFTSNLFSSFAEATVNDLTNGGDFSATNVLWEGTQGTISGIVLDNVVPDVYTINNGWFKPKKIKTSFSGSYTRKLSVNMAFNSGISVATDVALEPLEIRTFSTPAKIQKHLNNIVNTVFSSDKGIGYSKDVITSSTIAINIMRFITGISI